MSDNSSVFDGQDSNVNPAWSEILSAVPEEYHQALTPHLTSWDKGVNDRFQKIHDEYQDFKPYKEKGLGRDELDFAVNLAERIENEPLEIYQALESYLRNEGMLEALSQGEDTGTSQTVDEPNDVYARRISELETGFNTVAEAYLLEQQMKADAEQDALLESEISDLQDKYGDFDEEFVFAKAMNGMDLEDAVKSYFQFVDDIVTKKVRPAPKVISPSGSTFQGPATVDPRKWNEDQRIAAIAEYLERS